MLATTLGWNRSLLLLGSLPLACTLFALPCAARQWHVYADGSGDAPTIAAAIDSSAAPDTVAVHPGEYVSQNLLPKDGTVVAGSGGPRESIVLDGQGAATVFGVLQSDEDFAGWVIEGVTITGAVRGIDTVWPGAISVRDCLIHDCEVALMTRGCHVDVRDAEIHHCERGLRLWTAAGAEGTVQVRDAWIHDNSGYGFYSELGHEVVDVRFEANNRGAWTQAGAQGSFTNCEFIANRETFYGRTGSSTFSQCRFGTEGYPVAIRQGVYVLEGHHLTVTGSRFEGMFDNHGPAMIVHGSATAVVTDCDFAGNQAWVSGGAIYATGEIALEGCRFRDNFAGLYGGAIQMYEATAHVIATGCSFV
ncbi:right-handed parallel beta-helix repeat-containing protein, partial [bacterium]|nr:right-handed parallel beta-helix repeat-containing protein [bacterium]